MNIPGRKINIPLIAVALMLLFTAFAAHCEKKIIDTLPKTSRTITGFSRAALTARISEMDLHHIEGIWQFPATGVEVAICRSNGNHIGQRNSAVSYDIIVLSSTNRAIRPGTIMGMATPAPKRGEYDAKIYTKSIGSTLILPKRFTMTLESDDSALTLKQRRSAFSFYPWRLLPYLWRYTIRQNQPDQTTDGCIRIFPRPQPPREPIYL